MLYVIIRIIFFTIVFAATFVLIKRSKIVRKKLVAILSLVLCMVICSASYLLPVENLFINFKTPQGVFNYSCNGKIEDIVYGNNSCLVFSSDTYNIIPKIEKGYKISTMFSTKTVCKKIDRDGSFKVYNVSNTNDYYIWGTTISIGNDIIITDSNNSELKIKLTKNGNTDYYTVLIYGFVNNFTEEYYLLINGEKIALTSM